VIRLRVEAVGSTSRTKGAPEEAWRTVTVSHGGVDALKVEATGSVIPY
jgi:hypothetical protein